MSGHSQYSNRKRRIEIQGQKRNKVYLRVKKLILKAIKEKSDGALRNAIYNAQKESISKDKIDLIISSSKKDKSNYEEIIYEGYGPEGIAFAVHISTDNRNRTAGEIRNIFSKNDGTLGENGSIAYLFNKTGMIEYEISNIDKKNKIIEEAISHDVIDIEELKDRIKIYCNFKDLNSISDEMYKSCGEYSSNRFAWKSNDLIKIDDEEKINKISKFVNLLLDNEDVMYIDTNCDIQF